MVIRTARESGVVPEQLHLPRSTVHRLFSRHGLMRPAPSEADSRDRRRFAFAQAGELWMSDVMHGPKVSCAGQADAPQGARRKTYLIAFLDDATRVIPYCAFALQENTETFFPIFKQALLRRGVPLRLYVDNGANFRSQQLALVCAKLGITLIHARPYQPQGKGKLERWFRTVRAQFLARVAEGDLQSLDSLNKKLWAWVEGEYHHTPHRSLEEHTPLECWAQRAEQVRMIDPTVDLEALFLFEAKRRVERDRTVSLNGVLYEVDAALVGERVLLRYDPVAPPSRGVEVWHAGEFRGRARVVDAYANCFVKRQRLSRTVHSDTPAAPPPATGLSLRQLRGKDAPQ
jgi:transposase InsO family protein